MNFLPLLAILFIGLKLTGHIDWHWFWVVSPILIPLVIAAFWIMAGATLWIVAKVLGK